MTLKRLPRGSSYRSVEPTEIGSSLTLHLSWQSGVVLVCDHPAAVQIEPTSDPHQSVVPPAAVAAQRAMGWRKSITLVGWIPPATKPAKQPGAEDSP